MVKRTAACVVTALALLLISGQVHADLSLNVDGSLTDLGVTPGSDYVPESGVNSWIEPEIGSNGYLGPGYGGQTFNVEALYSTISNGKLYFAVITGLPPEGASGYNGSGYEIFYPGDILIDFEPYYIPSDNPTVPTRDFDFAVETTTYGASYLHGGIGAQGAGALFSDVTPGLARIEWDDVYYPYEIARDGSQDAQATLESTPTEFIYCHWGGLHYVIEGCIDADIFFGFGTVGGLNGKLSWTMGCANDIGYVSQTLEEDQYIPEPISLLLFAGSVAGAFLRRKRH